MKSNIKFIRLVHDWHGLGLKFYDIVYGSGRIRMFIFPEDMPETAMEFIRTARHYDQLDREHGAETIYEQ